MKYLETFLTPQGSSCAVQTESIPSNGIYAEDNQEQNHSVSRNLRKSPMESHADLFRAVTLISYSFTLPQDHESPWLQTWWSTVSLFLPVYLYFCTRTLELIHTLPSVGRRQRELGRTKMPFAIIKNPPIQTPDTILPFFHWASVRIYPNPIEYGTKVFTWTRCRTDAEEVSLIPAVCHSQGFPTCSTLR